MNFEITDRLIDTIKPYIDNATISISTDNKDWKGRDYKSDLVIVDEKNNVGFEVLDNEIIVFYFTDHCHFEDYSSDLEEGDDDYTKRARDFIINLFISQIKYIEIYKGKKIAKEEYYFVYSDNTEERIGCTWWGFERFINPFAKKIQKTSIYKYDKSRGCFDREQVF